MNLDRYFYLRGKGIRHTSAWQVSGLPSAASIATRLAGAVLLAGIMVLASNTLWS